VYPRAFTPGEVIHSQPNIKHANIIQVPDVPVLGVSASKIRAMLAAQQDCSFLLTERVLNYIEQRGLYQ
jgi:nicotinic acid mononucleotide adenylyltransferase